jgi:uncharacterized membrane protein
MGISIIRFLNVILAALLAGTSFGIWIGFNPNNLSLSTYVEEQQHLRHSLSTLMICMVVAATLITIASAFLQRKNKQIFITLLIASVFFIGCILISRFGNQPIQNDMMTWKANSVPANWTFYRDKWWTFHIMRTITELIALSLVILASIKRGNVSS